MREMVLYSLGALAIAIGAFALARGLGGAGGPPQQAGSGRGPGTHPTQPAAPAVERPAPSPTVRGPATVEQAARTVKPAPSAPPELLTSVRPALARLQAAFKEENGDAIEGTLAAIRGWIGSDPRRAVELIAEFDRMEDPNAADTLAMMLRDLDPIVSADAEVVGAFFKRATEGPNERARATSMMFLALANDLTEEQLRSIGRVGRSDGGAEVRRAALETLGSYIGRYAESARTLTPVLLEALRNDPDPNIRMQAATGLPVRDDPDTTIPALSEALGREREEDARIALVSRLGDAPATHRESVMKVLNGLAAGQDDADVKRQVLIAAVQVGGDTALPMLERIASVSGPLAQDAADYRDILKAGERDFSRILEAKERLETARGPFVPEDDHHHEGE